MPFYLSSFIVQEKSSYFRDFTKQEHFSNIQSYFLVIFYTVKPKGVNDVNCVRDIKAPS